MNTLSFIDYEIEASPLGKETEYPDLSVHKDPHAGLSSEGLSEKLYFGYGSVENLLPYKIRENYSRERKKTKVKAAVLENDVMKAVFLTEYGCRLWSLYDKVEQRELLFKNPVLQFANLALRNAWFAGGVEWNIGYIGHSPLTCEKMFCERVTDKETGAPVLRFYEFERIRRVVYEIDAYLNEEYRQLMVRVRIKNSHKEEIPMYWWSNIAVPESLDTRVIVDADSAFTHLYGKGIGEIPVPYNKTLDTSYSCLKQDAVDYFYRVPDDRQKFIAALDMNGEGLIQCSTKRLKGRKLFLWGMAAGGRTWQNFLSKPVHPYIEIQAGLARTQCECIPMPAEAEWEWLESYGFMRADSDKVHSDDWETAKAEVRNRIISEDFLDKELARTRKSIVGVKGELLQKGSGWAYLESLRRLKNGESPLCEGLAFSESDLDESQKPWLELLEKGSFTAPADPSLSGYMIQSEYLPMLEKAVEDTPGSWFAHLHLGVCCFGNGIFKRAEKEFEISNQLKENPYALNCLAYFAQQRNDGEKAAEYGIRAYKMDTASYALAKNCMGILIANGDNEALVELYGQMPEKLQQNGRVKYFYAKALVALNRLDEVEEILKEKFEVADLKEGEISLYDFWIDYCTAVIKKKGESYGDDIRKYIKVNYPIPGWLNFNMHEN